MASMRRGAARSALTVDIIESIKAVSEEQSLVAGMLLNQTELAEAMLHLTPAQNNFLRMRLLSSTDIEARHLAGHRPRPDQQGPQRRPTCRCPREEPDWVDLREDTVQGWRRDALFRRVYETMLNAPILFSITRIEQLSSMAVATYQNILMDPRTSVSVKRLAAKDILTMNGLIAGDGQQHAENSVQQSMSFLIARERWERGLELNLQQRQLLEEGGVNLQLPPPRVSRTLDGDDEQPLEAEYREVPAAVDPPVSAPVASQEGERRRAAWDDEEERSKPVRELEDHAQRMPELAAAALAAMPTSFFKTGEVE